MLWHRRGMPGHGVEWEQLSKDWGGQVMDGLPFSYWMYLNYVVHELGCVGAGYGGYSAFYLPGLTNFKTFIAHDGVFKHVC
jgi:hypothetical protein